jgi:CheY-like chemotaxis protein
LLAFSKPLPQGDHASGGGSHRFGGLGLGLAISKKLVEIHAGKIFAESAGLNRGTVFTVELPLTQKIKNENDSDPDANWTSPVEIPKSDGAQISVLLFEDHDATRTVLAQLLARRNYKVIHTNTIAGARTLAGQNKFDLLISGIGLPDGNGNDLMKELHESYGLKGIALTGYGTEDDIARGKAVGFVTHLVKPVRIQSLEKALSVFSNT